MALDARDREYSPAVELTCRIVLRPGHADRLQESGFSDKAAVEKWLRQHGKPGDRFRCEIIGPSRVMLSYEDGLIREDGIAWRVD
ncbi:MAG: hypothetical protein JWO37_171 [Acidimicrobiales bacterium]|jgi:hypothetical protein|nr:hypothetical protein [Acidimicrobiales bacterium]